MKIKISQFSYLIRLLSYLYFYTIGLTNRFVPLGLDYRQYFKENHQKVIIALWHSQLILPIYYFSEFGFSVIISKSEDGEIAAQAVKAMGIATARGSASRGGARGLIELLRFLKEGKHASITPDGPRGPKEHAQMGVITLAKLSGIPILPAAFDCTRKKRLNSWDGFIIPYPFGTIVYDTGELLYVPQDADDEMMEQKRLELETVMQQLTTNVNRYVNDAV